MSLRIHVIKNELFDGHPRKTKNPTVDAVTVINIFKADLESIGPTWKDAWAKLNNPLNIKTCIITCEPSCNPKLDAITW